MPTDKTRVYWDTCVVLSYIEDYDGRAALLDELLASADSGGLEIITSTFTVAEVAYTEAEKAKLAGSEEAFERITRFWLTHVIHVVELHELLAMDARVIVRESMLGKWKVAPKDAVHLATAQRLKVAAFHTYDKGLHGKASHFPFDICEPNRLHVPAFSGGTSQRATQPPLLTAEVVAPDRPAQSSHPEPVESPGP